MSLNKYYSEIRMDIAKDFGIEAAYAPRPKYYITVREAQRLNEKNYSQEKKIAIVKRLKAIRISNEKKVGSN